MMAAKLKLGGHRRRRAVIIVATIGPVVLLAGIYAFWSMNTWNSYKASYEGWQAQLRTDADAAIALPTTNVTERTKKTEALKAVSTSVTEAQHSLCSVPGIIGWQRMLNEPREREAACGRVVAKAEAFGGSVQAVVTYLESEQAVAAAITAAMKASNGKLTEAAWGEQVAIWKEGSEAIARVESTSAAFEPVKASALEKTKAVESAWQAVTAAHTKKDRAKYTQAQSKLTAAYGSLSSMAVTSTKQLAQLASSLQSAYEQTFGPRT